MFGLIMAGSAAVVRSQKTKVLILKVEPLNRQESVIGDKNWWVAIPGNPPYVLAAFKCKQGAVDYVADSVDYSL